MGHLGDAVLSGPLPIYMGQQIYTSANAQVRALHPKTRDSHAGRRLRLLAGPTRRVVNLGQCWDSAKAHRVSESRKPGRAKCGCFDKKPASCGSRIDHSASNATDGSGEQALTETGWLCPVQCGGRNVPSEQG